VTGNRDKTTLIQSAALILRFEEVGDVNKDGHPDFTIGHSGAKGVVINGHDASILWQKPLADKSWNVTSMGDITWDGSNDIAIGTLYVDNRTYFFDGANGDELYSVVGNTPVDALDAIPDIVGDNSMELVVGGRNGGVICLSGGYDSTLTTVPRSDFNEGHQAILYPNPASDHTTLFLSLVKPALVDVVIIDITGKEITRIKPGIFGCGEHTVDVLHETGSAILRQPGVFIVHVRIGAQTRIIKLVMAPF
jgi:hypothetical protein